MDLIWDRVWFWMQKHKLITVFSLTLVSNFWAQWYTYSLMHDWIIMQAFLGFVLPYITFISSSFWVDEKDLKERFKMTIVSSIAMVISSTAMLLMFRSGIGVGTDFIP